MNIILSGVETNNKGAELMLYAILQEIEKRHPEATVYLPVGSVRQGLDYLQTKVDVRYKPFEKFNNLLERLRIKRVLNKVGVHPLCFTDIYTLPRVDYFIDGSGLRFSDKMSASTKIESRRWKALLSKNKKAGAKVVFLPQAFGPFDKPTTRQTISYVNQHADIIFSREAISTKYLESSGMVDMQKVFECPDFTVLVSGIIPSQFENLKDAICIIPNMQMVDQGVLSEEEYVIYLKKIMESLLSVGEEVFLLNHQGKRDEVLGRKCEASMGGGRVKFLTGLNALEVKGLISQSKMVITSRFHGAVSALNSCVPCLATSWSHKYEELFKTYKQTNCVLPVNDINKSIEVVMSFVDVNNNNNIRESLQAPVESIRNKSFEMWNIIWNL